MPSEFLMSVVSKRKLEILIKKCIRYASETNAPDERKQCYPFNHFKAGFKAF